MKKILLFVAAALLLNVISLPAQAAEEVFERIMKTKEINCGYFVWPPYFTKDANTGKLSGIDYDIMEAIGKNIGFKLNWTTELSVSDVAAALEAKKIDMLCGTLWPSPARLQSMTLAAPAFYTSAYAYVRADDKRFDGDLNKANMKSVTIAAFDGSYTHDLAAEKLPEAKIASLPSGSAGSDLLLQIITKKADMVFSDEGLVNDFMKTNPGTLRKVGGIGPVRYYGEVFALKRGEYQMKNMMDQSINQLTNDGVLKTIVDHYNKQYNASFFAPEKSFTAK